MKKLKLVVLSLVALVFARPPGYCTANSAEAQAPEDNSPLALQCRGAGVDPADVRWRVQAGLDLDQAVQAALSQKTENERAAAEAAKAGKKKEGK
jgi:hypothetical protein